MQVYEGIPSLYYLSMSVIERLNAMYRYTVISIYEKDKTPIRESYLLQLNLIKVIPS